MHILGIDVGGSGIKGAVVDTETGKLVTERQRFKTPPGAGTQAVAEVVAQLVEHFSWKGWRFEVVDMDGRQIDRVLVSLAEGE